MIVSTLIVSLLVLASPAHAMQTHEWNFLGSNVPGKWGIQHFTKVEPTANGLHIQTAAEGQMGRNTDFPFPVEAAVMTFAKGTPTEGIFLWHVRGTPDTELVQLPFAIVNGQDNEVVELPLLHFPQWDRFADKVGFSFPAGADVTLKSITFERWNAAEKLVWAFRSFWKMDAERPYSINFLWGPVLTFNPISYGHLFTTNPPPIGWSVNRVFYGVMALAAFGCALWWILRRRGGAKRAGGTWRRPLGVFLMILAALWAFYDVRMGIETISYSVHDMRTYVLRAPRDRQFRERDNFTDFMTAALPFLGDRSRYIFLADDRWPYFGLARYLTYPSLPTEPVQAEKGVDTWIIYHRPDLSIAPDGALAIEGQPGTLPGRVLVDFGPGTFVFRTQH